MLFDDNDFIGIQDNRILLTNDIDSETGQIS